MLCNLVLMKMAKRRVVLDVDVGTDDYLALLLFFRAEKFAEIKIEAIICSMGNSSIDNVCKNVVRLLEVVDRLDIPVYRGVHKQLIPPNHDVQFFHGCDGFGGLVHDKEPNLSIIRKEKASVALANLVENNPGEISLICVGPLTNAALATRLYDGFSTELRELWIMGGNYTAVGNITAAAEYNFYIDPEAAHIVLDSLNVPIYIVTWETCLLSSINFDWRYNVFGTKPNNPAVQLLNRAEKSIYGVDEKNWYPCDAFLAAAYLYPKEIIVKSTKHHASVELHGSHTRGQIVLDHLQRNVPNVTIIEKIDTDKFKEFIMKL